MLRRIVNAAIAHMLQWFHYCAPWKQEVHDDAIGRATKVLALKGATCLKTRHFMGIQPEFADKHVENAFISYINNETARGSFVLFVLGALMGALYLQNDFENASKANATERLCTRSAMIAVFLMWGLMFSFRYRMAPRVVMWLYTCLQVCVSLLLNWRLVYEPEYVTYVRGVGIWSLGLKAMLACFEVGFSRFAVFVTADTAMTLVISDFRSATVESPWRWYLTVWVWFTAFGYFADRKARKAFAGKCELWLTRSVAEEASRLHQFLTDNTLDMICVHEISDVEVSRLHCCNTADLLSSSSIGRIKYVSKSCASLTGWSRSDLRNKSPLHLIHPDDMMTALHLYATHVPKRILGSEDVVVTEGSPMVSSMPASTQAGGSVVSFGFDDLAFIEGGERRERQGRTAITSTGRMRPQPALTNTTTPAHTHTPAAHIHTHTHTPVATTTAAAASAAASGHRAAPITGATLPTSLVGGMQPGVVRSDSGSDLAEAVRNHKFETSKRIPAASIRHIQTDLLACSEAGDNSTAEPAILTSPLWMAASPSVVAPSRRDNKSSGKQLSSHPQFKSFSLGMSAESCPVRDGATPEPTSTTQPVNKLSRFEAASAGFEAQQGMYHRRELVLDDLPIKYQPTPARQREPPLERDEVVDVDVADHSDDGPQRTSPSIASSPRRESQRGGCRYAIDSLHIAAPLPGAVSPSSAGGFGYPHSKTQLQRHGGNYASALRGVDLRFLHKDGGFVWLEVTRNETSEGIVCVYRDASWKHLDNPGDSAHAFTKSTTTAGSKASSNNPRTVSVMCRADALATDPPVADMHDGGRLHV